MFYNRTKSQLKKAKNIYGDYYGKCKEVLIELLEYYSNEKGYKIAMWGGGVKGIAFLNLVDKEKKYIQYVFDIDESKFNTHLPTGHIIVDYKIEDYQNVDVVLIMNNNFETEITCLLAEIKLDVLIVNVESIVCGNLSKEEVLELYFKTSSKRDQINDLKAESTGITIAALVILYHYDKTCIENISSYTNQVDVVYAFDNTEPSKKNEYYQNMLQIIDKVVYVDGMGNQGLSYAINCIAKKCIETGIDWLITFDQDSIAQCDMLNVMRQFIKMYNNRDKIGIISPIISNSMVKHEPPIYKYVYNYRVIQSGALHNLKAYLDIDGYDNNLFIDQVDYDYCVRLRAKGYQIIRLNDVILKHNVKDDNVILKYIHGRKILVNKFSAIRYYYIFRNNLYCLKKHKDRDLVFCADLKRDNKILFETWLNDNQKLKKAKAIIWAIIDFCVGAMGKCKHKF